MVEGKAMGEGGPIGDGDAIWESEHPLPSLNVKACENQHLQYVCIL